MKTYEEMSRSVMAKAQILQEKKKQMNRRIVTLAGCLGCAALIFAAAIWMPLAPTNDKQHTTRLIFLKANASEVSGQKMIENVTEPLCAMIRVKDVRKMQESEWTYLQAEERAAIVQVLNFTGKDNEIMQYTSDSAIITLGFNGRFCVTVNDFSQIEDVFVTTSKNGSSTISPQGCDTVSSSMIEMVQSASSLYIWWSLSDSAIEKLEEDPGMDLSQISDRVVVTVKFKDGSTEEAVIDMTVNNEGQIFYNYRGVTAK